MFFSSKGEVKSYKRDLPKLLKPSHDFLGYKKVNLYGTTKRKPYLLHVLIATLYVPNPLNLPFVDHIDRNKGNPAASNLRWVTASENAKNVDPNTIFGLSRRIFKCDLNGAILETYVSASEAARQNPDISYNHIKGFANGTTTINQGFLWVWEADNAEPYEPREGEIFRDIVGDFDGFVLDLPNYKISNFGTVLNKKGMKLKHNECCAYPRIVLYNKGKAIDCSIHRMVAFFFVAGRTTEKCIVNHIDENKQNFHFSNLQWCTQAENMFHSRYKNAQAVKQIHHPVTGETVAVFKSQIDACRSFGKENNGGIRSVISGLGQTCYGFKWERATETDFID